MAYLKKFIVEPTPEPHLPEEMDGGGQVWVTNGRNRDLVGEFEFSDADEMFKIGASVHSFGVGNSVTKQTMTFEGPTRNTTIANEIDKLLMDGVIGQKMAGLLYLAAAEMAKYSAKDKDKESVSLCKRDVEDPFRRNAQKCFSGAYQARWHEGR